jgi:multidrug efflux system outer membrane protein
MRRAWVVVAWLAGCAPKLTPVAAPEINLPETFAGADGAADPPPSWRDWFTDPALRAWIDDALVGGFAVRAADQAIAQAEASVRGARGARWPASGAYADASLTRFPAYTMDGAGYFSTPIDGRVVPELYPEYAIGLGATWEVSTWGRLRNLKERARAEYLASIHGRALIGAGVVASVASAWSELAALDRTLDILEASVARQGRALELVRAQKEAGRADELAVQQLMAELAETEAEAVDARQRRFELEGHLHVLAGRMPSSIPRSTTPAPPLEAPAAGLPADTLRRRPDVLEAEQRVAAAGFDVRAARAAFFPTIALSAGVGPSGFGLRYLASPESLAAGLAGGISAPLFNRAAIMADFQVARADEADALIHYQRTVVEAAVEVQSHLAGVERANQRVALSREQREAASRAAEASEVMFAVGRANYVDVLLAQQAVLEAERDLVAAELERELRVIALYRALGGGA